MRSPLYSKILYICRKLKIFLYVFTMIEINDYGIISTVSVHLCIKDIHFIL
jgi:hypothetical protein